MCVKPFFPEFFALIQCNDFSDILKFIESVTEIAKQVRAAVFVIDSVREYSILLKIVVNNIDCNDIFFLIKGGTPKRYRMSISVAVFF